METQDKELLEAQDRLLKKRALLNQTENHTPLISRDNGFKSVIEKIKTISLNQEDEVEEKIIIKAEDDEYNEKRAQRHLETCNIPKKYIGASFLNFTGNENLVKTCIDCALKNENIFISGQTGCGKTHLAVAILRRFIENRIKEMPMKRTEKGVIVIDPCYPAGLFITIPSLLMELRMTFSGKPQKSDPWIDDVCETEQDVIDKYTKQQILILDDLGAEKITEYSLTSLYMIIDARINNFKRTIVTTNLSLQEIEEKMDARLASRLAGMKNIKINMPDYRKKR